VPINTSANAIGHLELDMARVLLRPRERLNSPTCGQQVTLRQGRYDIDEERKSGKFAPDIYVWPCLPTWVTIAAAKNLNLTPTRRASSNSVILPSEPEMS